MRLWLTREQYFDQQARRRFAIVSVEEARSLTGLGPEHLCALGAEELTRVFVDGRREQALRVPAELVPSSACRSSAI